jgi:signal recognition particle GTPase
VVINVNQIQKRISEAAGVSLSSLKRILKEYEHNKRVRKELGTPKNTASVEEIGK